MCLLCKFHTYILSLDNICTYLKMICYSHIHTQNLCTVLLNYSYIIKSIFESNFSLSDPKTRRNAKKSVIMIKM